MNRRNRFVLFALLVLSSITAMADRGGFYYNSFHVDAVVHENNVWDVTETIEVTFTEPRHGIYRYIPTRIDLWHDVSEDEGWSWKDLFSDGSTSEDDEDNFEQFYYQNEIENITVEGGDVDIEYADDDACNCIIRIGDEWNTIVGKHKYVIHYTYIYSDDRRPQYDYIFHSVLGADLKEPINHFSFDVKFDKPLPDDIEDILEIYSGAYGNTDNAVEGLTVSATTKSISGSADNVQPNQAVTIFAQLPEGYFKNVLSVDYTWQNIFFIITLILIAITFICELTIKQTHITKVIEFYPPKGMSSAEVGVIIDEIVNDVDLASLIPWFASQGYLKIQEITDADGKSKNPVEMQLDKVKDLPNDAPEYQKKMMNLFFSDGDSVNLKDIGHQPEAFQKVKESLENCFKKESSLTDTKWTVIFPFFAVITSTLALASNSVLMSWDWGVIMWTLLLWSAPFFIGLCLRVANSSSDLIDGRWMRNAFIVLKVIVMLGFAAWYSICFVSYGAPLQMEVVIGLFIVCFIMTELSGRFVVDTTYRQGILGRLVGFKEFIETAEASNLESIQRNDPKYFYKVLPYAMVFGLTDKWTKVFENIDVQRPDWYSTNSTSLLNNYAFTESLVNNVNSSVNSAIETVSHEAPSPSSGGSYSDDYSGGYSGGGFSGGGGGGGGGGSW